MFAGDRKRVHEVHYVREGGSILFQMNRQLIAEERCAVENVEAIFRGSEGDYGGEDICRGSKGEGRERCGQGHISGGKKEW